MISYFAELSPVARVTLAEEFVVQIDAFFSSFGVAWIA
jgi:hypothetical protein